MELTRAAQDLLRPGQAEAALARLKRLAARGKRARATQKRLFRRYDLTLIFNLIYAPLPGTPEAAAFSQRQQTRARWREEDSGPHPAARGRATPVIVPAGL